MHFAVLFSPIVGTAGLLNSAFARGKMRRRAFPRSGRAAKTRARDGRRPPAGPAHFAHRNLTQLLMYKNIPAARTVIVTYLSCLLLSSVLSRAQEAGRRRVAAHARNWNHTTAIGPMLGCIGSGKELK